MDESDLHLVAVVITRIGRQLAHLDDGTGEMPAQIENLVAKTAEIERLEAERSDAVFKKLSGRRFGQWSDPNAIVVSPVEAPGGSDLSLGIAVPC